MNWNDVKKAVETGETFNPIPDGMQAIPVVGVSFIPGYPQNILSLRESRYSDLNVWMRRNPDNKYDSNAIEIHINGRMIGHLPKEVAAKIAPDMDSGIEHTAYVLGIRVSPENPNNPGIDLVVGKKR